MATQLTSGEIIGDRQCDADKGQANKLDGKAGMDRIGPATPRSIVVGGGIAGLSAAFSLSLLGHDVIVIDNREEYTRDQMIFFPRGLAERYYGISTLPGMGVKFKYLLGKVELIYPQGFEETKQPNLDLQFFRLLEKNGGVVRIKDFQEYQLQKFKQLLAIRKFDYRYDEIQGRKLDPNNRDELKMIQAINLKAFQGKLELDEDEAERHGLIQRLPQVQALSLSGQVTFLLGSKYEILEVDGDKQTLTLKEKDAQKDGLRVFHFDNLIDASGSNHEIANMLVAKPQYKLPAHELPHPRHNAYGMANFSFDRKALADFPHKVITPHLEGVPVLSAEHLLLLSQAGWKEDYFPFIYVAINKEEGTCYITGEIPRDCMRPNGKEKDESNEIEKQKKLIEWFKVLLNCLINLKEGNLHAMKPPTAFSVKTNCFSKNHCILGEKGKFIVVGDAFLPANFLYGHGAYDAILDGNQLFHAFAQNEFNGGKLDEQARTRLAKYGVFREKLETTRRFIDKAKSGTPPELAWMHNSATLRAPSEPGESEPQAQKARAKQ